MDGYLGVPRTAQLPSIARSMAAEERQQVFRIRLQEFTLPRDVPIHMQEEITGKIQNDMIHIFAINDIN